MRKRTSRGIAIIVVLQVLAVVLVSALALLLSTDVNSNFVRLDRRSSQSLYDAEGGVYVVLKEMYDKLNGAYVSSGSNPFTVIDNYNGRTITGTMTAPDGTSAGQYSVTCAVPSGSPSTDDPAFQSYKSVTLSAVGSVDTMRRSLNAVVKVGFKQPLAFQYATYINNYYFIKDLYCGVTINGNVAANGNLDLLNTPPTTATTPYINGNPVYDATGSVVSMGGLTAAGTLGGLTGNWKNYGASHQQNRAPFIQMPSISNMTWFASQAQGSITRGASTLVNKVYGQTGVKNIVLDGSSTPLTITGTVVIMGDCIIRGTINGRGTLYVGGNMYVAGNLTYGTHYSARPTYSSSDTPETYYSSLISSPTSWANNNAGTPAVSFCVANNIVLGDVSSSYWWNGFTSNATTYTNNSNVVVAGGINAMVNVLEPGTTIKYADLHEDTGFDKMWASTNESTESDGKWTVQVDNGTNVQTMDLTLVSGVAQVPSGCTVIPGTGEDVDGNGRYTPAATWNDFLFRDSSGNATSTVSSSTYTNWAGGTYTSFCGDVRNMNYPTHLDGFYFCNHLITGYMGNLNNNISMHGGYAARQLLTLIWANTGYNLLIEHDDRITRQFGNVLPGVAAVSAVQWQDGP